MRIREKSNRLTLLIIERYQKCAKENPRALVLSKLEEVRLC